ncbi:uncharacterized protein DNG_08107 [Cephalotrichum gorgonifer]|uniref:Dienelactone hydrolase domain-containing protein n=1 Tax=Cephalotrichum gorgonifer TaxID=2041049 RepID=A0AAE8N350_9PEZI|nr:uncharacterized protein DNG_08107 [Cephalotrichum gorgonifer]
MASGFPRQCCVQGFKHEGEPTGTMIRIGGKWDAYVATAQGQSKRKNTALLLMPDIMGVWTNIKLLADKFASHGYTCMVPDIFNSDALTLNDLVSLDIPKWVSEGSNGENPHTPKAIDPIVSAAIETLRADFQAGRVGSVGYCFGAKYAVRHLKSGIDVGYTAHPSFVAEEELAAIAGPLSIAAAEHDDIFTAENRHRSERILSKTAQPFQIFLYSNVAHGFAVRGDMKNKDQRLSKEQAFEQAIKCSYGPSNSGDDERHAIATSGGGADVAGRRGSDTQQTQLQLLQQLWQQRRDSGLAPTPDSTLSSLGGLVLSLQDQLHTLTSFIMEHHHPALDSRQVRDDFASMPAADKDAEADFALEARSSESTSSVSEVAKSVPEANSGVKRSTAPFYGPTSPEYSFNAARITMSRDDNQVPETIRRQSIPSLVEEMSDDDEDHCNTLVNDGDNPSFIAKISGPEPARLSRGLLRFSNLLSRKEAGRLLGVYQEIIGSIHPICDIESISKQLDRWYGPSPVIGDGRGFEKRDADELLVLGLALATALSAESVSMSDMASTIYGGLKDAVVAKLVAPVPTEKDVSITLMMGFYEYFNGWLRTAWRILVVLDRQWSAAAGLPPNFQMTDFDSAQPSATQNPYLKSMMTFTLMSHRFNEPISRVARGETCDDGDAFEVTVFQVEQWRRRTLENQNFTHALVWESAPESRPPSWTTMLYLRANAVRGILLRPFFLSSSTSVASKKIRPALELITDSVTTLSILDRATDTYRKQHPQFQHFLASSCALLFLVVAYAARNHAAPSIQEDLPHDYTETVRQNVRRSLALSVAYRESSSASRRLWKRLTALRESLMRLKILPQDEDLDIDNSSNNTTTNNNTGTLKSKPSNNTIGNSRGSNSSTRPVPVPAVGNNGGRPGATNDFLSFQFMNSSNLGTKETGGTYKSGTTQLDQGNMQYANLHGISHFDMPTGQAVAGSRNTEVPVPAGVEALEFSGADFLGNDNGLVDFFALDRQVGGGAAFFSEAGL